MNIRLFAAFLCLTAASTGCIIVDNGGGGSCCDTPPSQPGPGPGPSGRTGDVTVLWTFAGAGAGRCSDVPDVKKIRIKIPGETLHNSGIYACNTAGTDGIVLHDFVPANYSYTVEALSYTDEVLYQGSGSFTVNGDVRVNVNLTPRGSASSFAYVSWAFEPNTSSPNPNCNQAGVTHVDVRIDNGTWTRLGCEEGIGDRQVSSPYLEPGTHTIELVGVKVSAAGDVPYYYRSGTLTSRRGDPIAVSFSLDAVGGLSLRWELINGSLSKTCTEAGVSQVAIKLYDSTGKSIYGDTGDVQPCTGAPILYRFLKPGAYKVSIFGLNGTTVLYENNSPPTLTVKAFEQKAEKDAVTIYMQKK